MFESKILIDVENHVRELFKQRSVAENIYHNIVHTSEVVTVSYKIAQIENLSSDDTEILLIAAWFHDTGYFHCCHGHEYQSSEYARDFLQKNNFPPEKIEKVMECIKSTKIPHAPKSKLEEIICDADLQNLGMKDGEKRSELLRREFEMKGIKNLSDLEWIKMSLAFFKKHKYYTDFAKREFETQKNHNQNRLEQKLKKLEEQSSH